MSNLIKIIILILIICNFYILFRNNRDIKPNNIQTQTVKVTQTSVKPKQKQHKPNNIDNSLFSEEVINNRTYINKKFSGNYIDRTLNNGKLIRWNQSTFPLKVYIENNPSLPDYYYTEVRNAFEEWEKASNELLTFTYIYTKSNANIICEFPPDFKSEANEQKMITGYSKFNVEKNKIKNSKIKFASYNFDNKYFSEKEIYATALHEIGHSLGISGHSLNPQDIMYPASSNKSAKLSSNDIITLKLLYSIVPDISNKNFTDKQKEKYITTSDILGEYNTRINIELENTKDDLNASGHLSSNKFLRIAELNYQNKNYNDALKYAQTSYKLNPNDDAAVILAKIYYETENYEEAKNLLEKLIDRNPKIFNAYSILGNIYMKEKDYAAIEKLYIKGKNNFPDNPPIRMKKR